MAVVLLKVIIESNMEWLEENGPSLTPGQSGAFASP